MPIPDYQSFMLPVLEYCADGKEHSIKELYEVMADQFGLTDEDKAEVLPSGRQSIYVNRVSWARSYMKHAGLLHNPRRGYTQITDRGLEVLNKNPDKIDRNYLMQFPEFENFQKQSSNNDIKNPDSVDQNQSMSPQEIIEAGINKIQNELISDLLELIKSLTPQRFEKLVVELLVKMGYGGTLKDAGKAIGKVSDGGIDGIIKEDRLGLDAIYIQAKKWEGNVSRPEIQKFAGALQMNKAKKGVFITTSDFTKEATDCIELMDSKIILINGEQLARYMVDFNLGVSTEWTYEIKKIDSDYFE